MDHAIGQRGPSASRDAGPIDAARPLRWLAYGWFDLKRSSGPSLVYGAWVAAFGFALMMVAWRFTYLALDPIPVDSSGDFDAVLTDDSIGLRISLKGEVKRHGKAVVGTIKTNKFKVKKQTCKAPKQKFKTSNK